MIISLRRSRRRGLEGYSDLLQQYAIKDSGFESMTLRDALSDGAYAMADDLTNAMPPPRLCKDHLAVEAALPAGQLDASLDKLVQNSTRQLRTSISPELVGCVAMCEGYQMSHGNTTLTEPQAIMCWQVLERLEAVEHKYSALFEKLVHSRSVEGYMYSQGVELDPYPDVDAGFLSLASATPTRLEHLTPTVFIDGKMAALCLSYVPATASAHSSTCTDMPANNAQR